LKYLIALFFLLPSNLNAAELLGREYPYYIFKDEGAIRWCMQPDGPNAVTTTCWAEGIATVCKVLPIDEGYIDCKPEE